MRACIGTALLVAAVSSVSFPQGEVASGFALETQPSPGTNPLSASTSLSNGDFVVFDGTTIARYDASGALVELLGTLPAPVFPSFVLTDPDERRLFVGESSNGMIFRVFPDFATDPEPVTNLPFNYDAAMTDGATLYVSAATCGFTCGSEVWRVDLATRQATLVARVPGASGPILFDGEGNLMLATVTNVFPPPSGSSSVVRWSRLQLTRKLGLGPGLGQVAHAWLALEDATVVGTGFTGAFRMARDPHTDQYFLMENDYSTGENRIRWLRGSASESPVLVEGLPFQSMANLSFLPGEDSAQFKAYQPPSGGTLSYTTTDFVQPPERVSLRPLRPTADINGPGTIGPGEFFLDLFDGPPGGFARLVYGPSATYAPLESAYSIGGLPLFLGLALATLGIAPGVLPLDARGGLHQSYTNPGGLEGRFAIQLILYDATAELVGSSTAAFL